MMQQKAIGVKFLFVILFILFLHGVAVAAVPVPWGAKLINSDVVFSGGEERKIITYETSASNKQLLDYYLKEMPGKGYSLFMNGEQNLIFIKGEELVVIVLPPSMGGKTKFMVTTSSLGMAGAGRAEASCENIPSIPAYPGARCKQSGRLGSSGKIRTVMYFSGDTIEAVFNYYRSFMLNAQWRLEEESLLDDKIPKSPQEGITTEGIELATDLLKGARTMRFKDPQGNNCMITAMDNPIGSGTSISITYEEKISE
jgi:hypothetical protein